MRIGVVSFIPRYGNYRLIYCMSPYTDFSVLYCTECKKAYQNSTSNSYGLKLMYYEDFPSISCKKEICPKCIETLSVVEIG